MKLKSFSPLLLFIVGIHLVLSETPLNVNSPSPLGPAKCAFKSKDDPENTLVVYSGPPSKPNGTFVDCSEYQELACCDPFQVTKLRDLRTQLNGLLGSCPACVENVMGMWCSYTCSPYQGYFVNIESHDNSGNVLGTSFNVDDEYAQRIYESCDWIDSNGVKIADILPNYEDLFYYLSDNYGPITTLTYENETNALNHTTLPCADTCSCQSCKSSCGLFEESQTGCEIYMWGRYWSCLSVGLASAYLGFILLGFAVIVYVFYYKYYYVGVQIHPNTGGIQFSAMSNSIYELTGPKVTTSGYRYWHAHGRFVARHPYIIIFFGLLITGLCGIGLKYLAFEEHPSRLWIPPDSRATNDRAYFNDQFGPIWRSEQIIVTPKNGGPVLTVPILLDLLALQQDINGIQIAYDEVAYNLKDLCFDLQDNGCLVESVLEFWQNNATKILTTVPTQYIEYCVDNLLTSQCLSSIGLSLGPVLNSIFGGFNLELRDYSNSSALVVTYMLKNTAQFYPIVYLWENKFLEIVQQDREYINLAYIAGNSMEEELSRELFANNNVLIGAYVAMFLYVSLTLGDYFPLKNFSQLFVKSKFLLGFAGVFIVICSLVISYGLCGFSGVKASLVVNQVLPFLILATGIDNVFILSNTYQSLGNMAYMSSETRLGETLARVGSSITLTSVSACMAFLLGSLTRMPAVQTLSIYASAAVFFNFALQITCFVAFMVIDGERKRANRVDCLPCIKLSKRRDSADITEPLLEKKQPKRRILGKFVENIYAPLILHPLSKILIVYAFVGILFIGINYSSQVEIGLDRTLVLPNHSYLHNYYDAFNKYVVAGPSLFIVVRNGFDYTNETQQNAICTIAGCDKNSVVTQYDSAPYMLGPTSSWLDGYLQYASIPECCYQKDGVQCIDNTEGCTPCFTLDENNRPLPDEFVKYLPWYLMQNVSQTCTASGLAFQHDVEFTNTIHGNVSTKAVGASRLKLSHTALKTQSDYINALNEAYLIADESNLDIFPFSNFYAYYEQFLYIKQVATLDLCLALGGALVISIVLMQNPWISILVIAMVVVIEVNVIAVMQLWGIDLNAVSVVNLAITIGIGLEFCSHIAYSFSESEGTKDERVKIALTEMGTSVFSGITLTKACGIVVFSFSESIFFETYYFRMFLTIAVVGAVHGLVFFPVLLSLIGSPTGSWIPFTCKKKEYRY